ncbi:MAG: alpha/beta hydrolase [Abitibacteriaceae bacterium]|nr:alpha/beta hydrolase [Abditibacteriaceae bacterium]
MATDTLGFIHEFVPAQSSDAPTLLLLHGTGGSEADLVPLGQALAPGAALLSPRGKVSENGMPRFFRRLAEGVFDMEDLKLRTHELAEFVAAAAQSYGFDVARVIAVGYSNGANIAASVMLLRPGVLSGAALFHPMVPLVPEPLPDLSGTSVFIGAGRFDPMVPQAETERLAALLKECGAGVTVQWQPGGHQLSQPEVAAAAAWLTSQLTGNSYAH